MFAIAHEVRHANGSLKQNETFYFKDYKIIGSDRKFRKI